MNKTPFTEIKTNRLLLRKLTTSDWEMISYLRTDRDVNKFVKRPEAESKEKAIEFISKTNKSIENGDLFYWVISEKNSVEMIGSICLWNFSSDRKTAEIGYDLSPKFQRKGIMNESLRAILEFGFKKLMLDLIEAYTHKKNKNSIKLLERNDFKCMPDIIDEQNRDNIIYELKAQNFSVL